ncbi:MAG: alkaline phosphatase family protein [Anaerolineae bacterium]
MESENYKAIILGLDGATFDLLLPRIQQGQMPNLAGLLERGTWGTLHSTLPPFSAQAWVSLATGQNQARHGVVDFWEPSPDHVHRRFVSSRHIQSETLWQMASRHGRRVGVVNVPLTYPPQAVNGYLVSGFLTPQDKTDFTYPPELKREIEALVPDYRPDPFDPLGATRQQILEIERWMHRHEQVARHLMDHHPVDLFFNVVQALDHLQHLFWQVASQNERGPDAPLIDRCFQFIDQMIGHRWQRLDGRTVLFLVSDHGFGPVRKRFQVNRWLWERGFLALGERHGDRGRPMGGGWGLTPQRARALIRRLDFLGVRRRIGRMARVTLGRRLDQALTPPIDWSRTQAVSGSPAVEGIYLNLKGREPQGIVEPGAPYEAVRERLMAELRDLRDPETGEPVVQAVYRREEVYRGPFLDLLPDVVLDVGDHPYLVSDALTAPQVLEPLSRDDLQGRHRSAGIFVAVGPHIRATQPVEGIRIVDVAPTVLYALDLPIPEDMDGRPLLEIFCQEYQATHPVRYGRAERPDQEAVAPEESPDEAADMERRLRGLGYIS